MRKWLLVTVLGIVACMPQAKAQSFDSIYRWAYSDCGYIRQYDPLWDEWTYRRNCTLAPAERPFLAPRRHRGYPRQHFDARGLQPVSPLDSLPGFAGGVYPEDDFPVPSTNW